ncbi:MAG: molybdenum ABC transporter ATP-binding protein [Halioglobus sp.]
MSELKVRIKLNTAPTFQLAVDCSLPDRGITAIYGHSGSGKTTLLNCIAGLQTADAGSEIIYRGETWQSEQTLLPPWQRDIGFVFQDARLFPHLNVRQNLDYAIKRRRKSSKISLAMVSEWLHLEDLLQRPATQLSAGQKQRVAIARALLSAPRLLLLDEPLANLDKLARQQCLRYLHQLRDTLDLPMLYVSHDMEEVSQLADNLVLMNEGRIDDQGSVLDLCSRLDSRLSHEEQAATILIGDLQRHDVNFGLSELDVEGHTFYVKQMTLPTGARCRLRIPARDISICRERPTESSILNILPVTLQQIEQTSGARVLLRLALGGQYLLARITRKSVAELNLTVGDSLYAQIKSVALLSEIMEKND